MTRDEVKKILYVISSTYPNFKTDNMTATVDAWLFILEDFNYNDVAMALKSFIYTSNSGFAPSVAELIAMIHKPAELAQITEQEAWSMVRAAISRSIYHSEEEFDKFPDEIKQAVGSASQLYFWAQTDLDTIDTVVASNFMRSYRAKLQQINTIKKLPAGAFNALAGIESGADYGRIESQD